MMASRLPIYLSPSEPTLSAPRDNSSADNTNNFLDVTAEGERLGLPVFTLLRNSKGSCHSSLVLHLLPL